MPGERFNRTIVDLLRVTRVFNGQFPGFATDVHGLVEMADGDWQGLTRVYYVDCVAGDVSG